MGSCVSSFSKGKFCKECKSDSNKTFGKVESDGFHKGCRTCSKCGKGFYYLNDVPVYVDVETKQHSPSCAPIFTPYTFAVLTSDSSKEPDIR